MPESKRVWDNIEGAIVERPREITRHPLLDSVYQRHDRLIAEFVSGRTLEVAFGRHAHPLADVGVEAFRKNNRQVKNINAITADARSLPFINGSFQTVIGRRFIHHVATEDRTAMLKQIKHVLSDDGKLVLIEGTPGLYRQFSKGLAFKLGILGEDNDEYGHLTAEEVTTTVHESGFRIVESKPLGSPLMPFCGLEADWTRKLMGLYNRTQFIRWWTFIVAEPA